VPKDQSYASAGSDQADGGAVSFAVGWCDEGYNDGDDEHDDCLIVLMTTIRL